MRLEDGSFYGTLCAIDPAPRDVSGARVLELLNSFAEAVGRILSDKARA